VPGVERELRVVHAPDGLGRGHQSDGLSTTVGEEHPPGVDAEGHGEGLGGLCGFGIAAHPLGCSDHQGGDVGREGVQALGEVQDRIDLDAQGSGQAGSFGPVGAGGRGHRGHRRLQRRPAPRPSSPTSNHSM